MRRDKRPKASSAPPPPGDPSPPSSETIALDLHLALLDLAQAARILVRNSVEEALRDAGLRPTSATELIPVKSSPAGRKTTLNAIKRGELRGFKVGREIMVRADDLRAWMESCPVTPSAAARKRPAPPSSPDGLVHDLLRRAGLHVPAATPARDEEPEHRSKRRR